MTSPATNEAAVSPLDAAAHSVKAFEVELLEAALSYAARSLPVFHASGYRKGIAVAVIWTAKVPGNTR
jgi:hypothetical protein